ncbi:hypothetical protein WH52_00595 [Tenacibaculum holothuriorum]|uniref:N-acetyltransferase domain-containing protein n=1 Tax=Tenacibaculum holothuriorum TaxID=1635173 RepID=A0A1Y2PHM8_9FLAO|nr:GNAT family protein [Tenacibaculum holothuriorum]OSY89188.1 hypothetical protein WH52_00595 [Tenacibaculum holothuriorum]
MENISVREMLVEDINFIVDYFHDSSEEFIRGMGASKSKFLSKEEWYVKIHAEVIKNYKEKQLYYTIWELNNKPIGHCNINKLVFNKSAYMHLQMWDSTKRKKGLGVQLVKKSLPFFFNNFKLENLFCEPYALNPAPNKTLPKAGFDFVKTYKTSPGRINFYQQVNKYVLTQEKFNQLYK